jgi:HAD superfamily hydrolase (TIGR01484 family)
MDNNKPYLRLFFDMDNTLTRSRTRIEPRMKELLEHTGCDIVVVSGQSSDAIRTQVDGLACYVLGQNGNDAWHTDEQLWYDPLTAQERAEISAHIASTKRSWDVPDENDLVEDRGCSICYSLLGHHAPIELKEAFDPDQVKRLGMLHDHPLNSETVDAKIAGTTTIDYFRKGHNKGFNIARLCEYKDWNLDNCIYFGDALFPGGNDETVIGIIDTVSVKNHEDTYEKLLAMRERFGRHVQ